MHNAVDVGGRHLRVRGKSKLQIAAPVQAAISAVASLQDISLKCRRCDLVRGADQEEGAPDSEADSATSMPSSPVSSLDESDTPGAPASPPLDSPSDSNAVDRGRDDSGIAMAERFQGLWHTKFVALKDPVLPEVYDTGKIRQEKALVFHVGTVYHLDVAIVRDVHGKSLAFDGSAGLSLSCHSLFSHTPSHTHVLSLSICNTVLWSWD